MAYFRRSKDQTILVIANFQKEARDLPLPGKAVKILLTNLNGPKIKNGMISLAGYQAAVLLMRDPDARSL